MFNPLTRHIKICTLYKISTDILYLESNTYKHFINVKYASILYQNNSLSYIITLSAIYDKLHSNSCVALYLLLNWPPLLFCRICDANLSEH